MKTMKQRKTIGRLAALVLGTALFAGSLAGCGAAQQKGQQEPVSVRVGSLKGPTSLGILSLMEQADEGKAQESYTFQMAAAADELLPLMVKDELDIALVPANVAAALYQKTDGGIAVIDINTLGVLYAVTGASDVSQLSDLKGRSIYLTGKGATPEASLRYLLDAQGLTEDDYTLEFKSEAAEVVSILTQEPEAVGILPQPFVTAACMQNPDLQAVIDLNEAWVFAADAQGKESNGMVTGVTIVRRAFLEEHPETVDTFLEEHAQSVEAVLADPAKGASLAVAAGIVAKEPVAQKAIPECNLVCVTGEQMREDLSAYLQVLNDFEPQLIGGQTPDEAFYYIPEK